MTMVNMQLSMARTISSEQRRHERAEPGDDTSGDPFGRACLIHGHSQWYEPAQQKDRTPIYRAVGFIDRYDPGHDHADGTQHEADR